MNAVEENGTAGKSIDSKVRWTPEMYEDLKRRTERAGPRRSFQSIIEEALRVWMTVEDAPQYDEFRQGMAAAAVIFRDAIADAKRKQYPQKALIALSDVLDTFISRVDVEYLPALAELVRGLAPVPHSDPAVQYIVGVMEAPKNAEEEALAAYLRALASR